MELKVEVDQKRIEEEVASNIWRMISTSIEEKVNEAVSAHLSAKLLELTDERVQQEVEKVLSEGWHITNNYGEPTGKKNTISTLVRDHLSKDSYGRDGISRVVGEIVGRDTQAEFKKVLAEVTAALKAILDTQVADKLIDALHDALKLKR